MTNAQKAEYQVYNWELHLDDEVPFLYLSPDEAGVFESIRTYGDVFFRLDDHLSRLKESAQSSGYVLPQSLQQIKSKTLQALKKYREANSQYKENDVFMRLTLFREKVFFIFGKKNHPKDFYEKGVILKTTVIRRPFTNAAAPQIKTHGYHAGIWAAVQPRDDVYEWLFLDSQGFVSEVSVGNIFLIKKKALLTPPTRGILDGVTRRFVLECALQMQLQVKEIPLTRHEVFNADEVFLTNTSWELMPVAEVDRRRIGTVIPGLVTQAIHQKFKEEVFKECRIQK